MNAKCSVVVAAAGLFGAIAHASAQEVTITYSIKWELQDPVFPGVPNKGEVWATISPAFGTKVLWWLPGNLEYGSLAAFASSVFDIVNVSNATMGSLSWTVPEALNYAGISGEPDGNGGIKGTHSGQLGKTINPNPSLDNPIKILDLEWTGLVPGNGETIAFATKASSAKVFLDLGLPSGNWAWDIAKIVNGGGSFYYGTPAPSAAAVAGIALAFAARRRR
jgi:hypothetical protein